MGEPIHSREFSVPAAHPSLPGHFPGNAIVPGALLLDFIRQVIFEVRPESRIKSVRSVKFSGMVLPEQRVVLQLHPRREGIAFTGRVGGVVVLSGVLVLVCAEDIP